MARQMTLSTFAVATSTRSLFTTTALRRLTKTSHSTNIYHFRPRLFSATASSRFTQNNSKMTVHVVGDKNEFNTQVVQASNEKVIVVDFFATWCGPCKAISPIVDKWSNEDEYKNVGFYKVDVDKASDVAADYGIRAMPTFLIFKNGEKVEEIVGASPGPLKKAIDDVL